MERITLNNLNTRTAAARAASALRAGGIVLYPTDTLYGLGADAISNTAVAKIFEAKGRNERKPIHAIVADLAMARQYGEVPEIVDALVRKLPPGKITFIVKKRAEYDSGILRGTTFGFRIPDNAFCIEMIRALGGPITATSANRAGEMPATDVDGILAQLQSEHIDVAIDNGELPVNAPSTVLDLSTETPRILREAAVTALQIGEYLPLV